MAILLLRKILFPTNRFNLCKNLPDTMLCDIPNNMPGPWVIFRAIQCDIGQSTLVVVDPLESRRWCNQRPSCDRKSAEKYKNKTNEEEQIFHLSKQNRMTWILLGSNVQYWKSWLIVDQVVRKRRIDEVFEQTKESNRNIKKLYEQLQKV